MAGFFIFSIACLCLAGAFLLAVLAYIANFNLWKPKKIWHKPSEEPNEYKKVFYEWNTDVVIGHDVGFYHKDTKDFSKDHKHQRYMSEVAKWAYVEDLVAF